jgi:hypothetical protein
VIPIDDHDDSNKSSEARDVVAAALRSPSSHSALNDLIRRTFGHMGIHTPTLYCFMLCDHHNNIMCVHIGDDHRPSRALKLTQSDRRRSLSGAISLSQIDDSMLSQDGGAGHRESAAATTATESRRHDHQLSIAREIIRVSHNSLLADHTTTSLITSLASGILSLPVTHLVAVVQAILTGIHLQHVIDMRCCRCNAFAVA